MSQAALAVLRDANSLAQTLTFEQLEAYHVPFDELAATPGVESNVRYWSTRRGRVALVGESGAGKSSILAAELGAFSESVPEALVPVRVPVALAGPAEVTEVAEFGRHVVRHVLRWAAPEALDDRDRARIEALAADLERKTGRRRRAGFGLGTSDLLPFHGELSADFIGAASDFEQRLGSGDVVMALRRMVDAFSVEALTELGSLYDGLPDLRRIMGIAGLAVRKAHDDDEAEIVTAEAISLARAERDPLRGG